MPEYKSRRNAIPSTASFLTSAPLFLIDQVFHVIIKLLINYFCQHLRDSPTKIIIKNLGGHEPSFNNTFREFVKVLSSIFKSLCLQLYIKRVNAGSKCGMSCVVSKYMHKIYVYMYSEN